MSDNIKVSVIIPFYNRIDWLEQAVGSVFNQTYSNIEVIVVNDGSKENISNFLNKYSERIIYIHKKNEGPGATRNCGIEIATGDYLTFLDSDDLWLPHKTEKQLSFMLENDYIWSHTGGAYFQDDCISELTTFNFRHNSAWVARRSLISMQIATPSVMIRADVLKRNKEFRFNATMRYSQDTFFYQVMAQYYRLGYLDEECVLIRLRTNSKDIQKINANKRFRIRFTGRKVLYDFIKSKNNHIIKSIPLYIQLLLKQYVLGDRILSYLERKNYEMNTIETLAKILFLYLFALGRIYIYVNDHISCLEDVSKFRYES